MLALNASGQGSFDNPELQATVESPSLTVSNQTISALKLQLNLANHVANAALSSTALNTPIQAKATVHLSGRLSGGRFAQHAGAFAAADSGALLAR